VGRRLLPGLESSVRNGGKSVRSSGCPQLPWSQVQQFDTAEQNGCRVGHQDLTAVAGRRRAHSAVEHRPEVVSVPQFGFAGRDAHPHRQLKLALRIDRHVRRRESGDHTVEPSISVNRNVTTPEGGRPADTRTESHITRGRSRIRAIRRATKDPPRHASDAGRQSGTTRRLRTQGET
jgi:hypothetical protein